MYKRVSYNLSGLQIDIGLPGSIEWRHIYENFILKSSEIGRGIPNCVSELRSLARALYSNSRFTQLSTVHNSLLSVYIRTDCSLPSNIHIFFFTSHSGIRWFQLFLYLFSLSCHIFFIVSPFFPPSKVLVFFLGFPWQPFHFCNLLLKDNRIS